MEALSGFGNALAVWSCLLSPQGISTQPAACPRCFAVAAADGALAGRAMMQNVFYCNGQLYSFVPAPNNSMPSYQQPPIAPMVMPQQVPNYPPQAAAAAQQQQPQNKGLVADLCKIIERQSQEIASLVQTRNAAAPAAAAAVTPVEAPKSPTGAAVTTIVPRGAEKVEYAMDGEVRAPTPRPNDRPNPRPTRPFTPPSVLLRPATADPLTFDCRPCPYRSRIQTRRMSTCPRGRHAASAAPPPLHAASRCAPALTLCPRGQSLPIRIPSHGIATIPSLSSPLRGSLASPFHTAGKPSLSTPRAAPLTPVSAACARVQALTAAADETAAVLTAGAGADSHLAIQMMKKLKRPRRSAPKAPSEVREPAP